MGLKIRVSNFIKVAAVICAFNANAQDRALVNLSASPNVNLGSIDLGDVSWTNGFWADRTRICFDNMIPSIWDVYTDPDISHAFRNFEIAAGLHEGEHKGPSFHDGDFYKVLEAVVAAYAQTKDPALLDRINEVIPVIEKAQREDGYIYTKASIDQRNKGEDIEFQDRLSFEAYNIGHLMTAGCLHYRITNKRDLLDIAIKAADYLYGFYKSSNPTLARNAICPSHYMGTIELYRTVKDPKYLELAKHLIDIKGEISDGTDDNQDRVPFREQNKAMGHAVRATYLYAGVADLVAELQDTTLSNRLLNIWEDMTETKMYITAGVGSLYDGVSPDGTSYNPDDVQKIHQAFGRDYQLPNLTAHNETCANIGNVLWNWRMAALTGEGKYIDVLETALYNSVLSGVSMDGDKYLYTNPLAYAKELPFQQRWSKQRVPYIELSNCCPPNTVRTVAEVSSYAYGISKEDIWVNLYGANELNTTIGGKEVTITQETNYPWQGQVKLTVHQAGENLGIKFRIPGWAENVVIKKQGKEIEYVNDKGYASIRGEISKGDVFEIDIPLTVDFMEANPLVEESKNQVAIKRGPVVYCLEEADLDPSVNLFDLKVKVLDDFKPVKGEIMDQDIYFLEGNAYLTGGKKEWNSLYRKIDNRNETAVPVRLVPYFAWGNREFGDMSVWLPKL
ncbi:MAG TPA: glycoside hydrolase family 127 protein [Candidatus Sphingobacterium stercoripullorum]|uniref:Glycoside hydrolase family 127 protein n=1 Tax=Candidatus Sphingobacterium stercoripullorum TaxID=2838759 RepID=A0A9D1W7N0_9SPHI|nr:glycoside hydrolase family 127 protein [Candidatus Sphingobacterium stercoripullorum]